MLKGFWTIKKTAGAVPDSREDARMVCIDKTVYLFGGFARDRYCDMHILKTELLEKWKWKTIFASNIKTTDFDE
jgi:hypothetical protein